MAAEPDFFMGDRDSGVTDFDGRIRACFIRGRLDPPSERDRQEGHRLVWVAVDPALPMPNGTSADQVALTEHWEGGQVLERLEQYGPYPVRVRVFTFVDPGEIREGPISPSSVSFWRMAEVARDPSLLPKSPEEQFEFGFQALLRYVAREGHADVPANHRQGDVNLGAWVENMRYSQANRPITQFPPRWEARLNEVPGWRWLLGDDVYLVERYALREGHTRIPEEHFEEGRPLGQWVQAQRANHRAGILDPNWERRLEAIPHWEW